MNVPRPPFGDVLVIVCRNHEQCLRLINSVIVMFCTRDIHTLYANDGHILSVWAQEEGVNIVSSAVSPHILNRRIMTYYAT